MFKRARSGLLSAIQIIFLASAACVTWPNITSADVPLNFYRANVGKNLGGLKDYVVGVGRGVFWSNAYLSARGGTSIFCMPDKLNLDEGIILSLLDQEIRSPSSGNPWKPDTPVELIMVVAFSKKFPCNER